MSRLNFIQIPKVKDLLMMQHSEPEYVDDYYRIHFRDTVACVRRNAFGKFPYSLYVLGRFGDQWFGSEKRVQDYHSLVEAEQYFLAYVRNLCSARQLG